MQADCTAAREYKMTMALAFWILMLLTVVLGAWLGWGRQAPVYVLGGSLVWWVLFLLLGIEVFGPPIRG